MTDLTELRTSAERLQAELDTLKQTIAEEERRAIDPVIRPTGDNKGYGLTPSGVAAGPWELHWAEAQDLYDNWRPTEQEAKNEQALRKLKKRFKDATARLRAQYPMMVRGFFVIDKGGNVTALLAEQGVNRAYWLYFPYAHANLLRHQFTSDEIKSVITESWTGEAQ